MVRTSCKKCGAAFWETYRGARAETGDFGDVCDRCEGELIAATERVDKAEAEYRAAREALTALLLSGIDSVEAA